MAGSVLGFRCRPGAEPEAQVFEKPWILLSPHALVQRT